jgi:hypothetical protein
MGETMAQILEFFVKRLGVKLGLSFYDLKPITGNQHSLGWGLRICGVMEFPELLKGSVITLAVVFVVAMSLWVDPWL